MGSRWQQMPRQFTANRSMHGLGVRVRGDRAGRPSRSCLRFSADAWIGGCFRHEPASGLDSGRRVTTSSERVTTGPSPPVSLTFTSHPVMAGEPDDGLLLLVSTASARAPFTRLLASKPVRPFSCLGALAVDDRRRRPRRLGQRRPLLVAQRVLTRCQVPSSRHRVEVVVDGRLRRKPLCSCAISPRCPARTGSPRRPSRRWAGAARRASSSPARAARAASTARPSGPSRTLAPGRPARPEGPTHPAPPPPNRQVTITPLAGHPLTAGI